MKKLFFYLGDSSVAYRTIMKDHTDFVVNDVLIAKQRTVITEQTHSNHVLICSELDSGAGFDDHPQIADCDAMVTNLPNQFLLIRTADCTPILCYDKNTHSIGAAHSGREGTRKNIAGKLIKAMQSEYNTNPADIQVWIGPGICKQHYQVNEKIYTEFIQTCKLNGIQPDEAEDFCINIQDVITKQLIQSGIKLEHINKNAICTYESDAHFSFRRDGTHNRQINVIGLIDG